MASIFRNGKYWRAQVRKTGYPTKTRTFDTKSEAITWAAQVEQRLAHISPDQAQQEQLQQGFTMGMALDRYVAEVLPSKSEGTQKRESAFVKAWRMTEWNTMPLTHFRSPQMAQAIRQMEQQGYGANTIRLHCAVLSHLFTVAAREWGFEDLTNPVKNVRRPRLPEGRKRRLVDDEEERLLAVCNQINPELADIVTFAIETAQRQGTILALEWDMVRWKEHVLELPANIMKQRASLVVPLTEKAEEALNRQRERNPREGKVWTYETQDGLRASYFKAVKRTGITGLTFHDLRHEATSRLFERGLNAAIVQGVTGHKTTQMLARYTHISGKSLVEAVRGSEAKATTAPVPAHTTAQRPATQTARKFCTECGAPLERHGQKFCGECGLTL